MTRLAVISDVHANVHALRAVLAALRPLGVDRFVCAGDIVGYGAHPNECIEILQALPVEAVAGNHDLISLGAAGYDRCDTLARTTLEWTAEHLSADSRTYLEQLPMVRSIEDVTVTHGSLANPFEYVRSPQQAMEQLAQLRESHASTSILILGHTHIPVAFTEGGTVKSPGRRTRLHLQRDRRHLLNPGSVGQSRDRSPDARCLVLDTGTRHVTFMRVAYDKAACVADLLRHGLPAAACHRRPKFATGYRRALRAAMRRR